MIITLTGTNSFELKRELGKLVADFVAAHTDMGLERLEGDEVEFQKIYDALTSLPFLVSRKMVVIRNASANKAFLEKFEDLLKDLPEITDVIIVEPKLDKRLSYYKFLKKSTDFREFNELDANNLARWLVEQTHLQGATLQMGEARLLIDRVGANQQLLGNELDKLVLHNPKISRQTIEALTEREPQSTIFELLDAAFAGNPTKALQLYTEQRAMKVEPQQIIAMLAWQLHVLAAIKTAGDRSADEIAREAKLNPFVVRKSLGIARRLTLVQLKKLIAEVLALDVRLKSESLNADEALQLFLLNLSA